MKREEKRLYKGYGMDDNTLSFPIQELVPKSTYGKTFNTSSNLFSVLSSKYLASCSPKYVKHVGDNRETPLIGTVRGR